MDVGVYVDYSAPNALSGRFLLPSGSSPAPSTRMPSGSSRNYLRKENFIQISNTNQFMKFKAKNMAASSSLSLRISLTF